MSKFRNYYECRNGHRWTDVWDCQVEDDCPTCGARRNNPYRSEDMDVDVEGPTVKMTGTKGKTITVVVAQVGGYNAGSLVQSATFPIKEADAACTAFHVWATLYGSYIMPRRDAWYAEYMREWIDANPDCGLVYANETPSVRKKRPRL